MASSTDLGSVLESQLPALPGERVGERYLVGSVLGEGGMGVVCAATHIGLGTPVAIKFIHSTLKDDPAMVERFLNEARTVAALRSDHVVRVFDVGRLPSGEPYLVMERLDGMGLDAFLSRHGPLAQTEAVDIMLQACLGLADAHAVGLVHRDIKPSNFFLAQRSGGHYTLKVLDFGISKRLFNPPPRGLTNPGTSLGSPWYMSPEQMLNAAHVDQRADVWSMGVLLFELLTGACPFEGDSLPQVCAAVMAHPAPHLRDFRDDVAPGLDRVLGRCLEKEPERRFQSVSSLAEALRPFAASSSESWPTLAAGAVLSSDAPVSGDAPTLSALSSLTRPPRTALRRAAPMAMVTLGALLGVGCALAWPALQTRYGAGIAKLQVQRWPWEPELASGPAPPPLSSTRLSRAAPRLVQRLRLSRAVPEPAAPPTLDAPLSAAEIERRKARYQAWLLSQGLTPVPRAADGSPGTDENPYAPLEREARP